MKKITLLICMISLVTQASSQVEKLAGPRFGFTYITDGSLMYNLNSLPNVSDANPVIAQFGWQFERQFMNAGSTAGIVEFIPLLGGFEQGLFLPSFSTLVGIRKSNGFEFAMGPNLSLSGVGMVFGAGFNIKSGNINFPINIAYVPSVNKLIDFDEFDASDIIYQGQDENGNDSYTYVGPTTYPNGESVIINPNGTPVDEFNWKTGHRISIIIGFNTSKN